MPHSHRQVWLGALQCLALRFLVAARPTSQAVKTQSAHVPEPRLEVLVPGELERLRPMGLEVMIGSDTLDGGMRHTCFHGQSGGAPALAPGRLPARLARALGLRQDLDPKLIERPMSQLALSAGQTLQ